MRERRLRPARDDVAVEVSAQPHRGEALRLAEALLFAAPAPLSEGDLAARLPAGIDVAALLAALAARYATAGINLVRVAGGYAFRTAPDLAGLLAPGGLGAPEPRRLSRAALETLAIIAYHQPVTRAEIEEIRGVTTSKGSLDVLLEAGFVRLRGRRRSPGRPVTYGTTRDFLAHFGLDAVADLPGLEDLRGLGLLEGAGGLAVPSPRDDAALRDDEEPLGPGAPRDAEPDRGPDAGDGPS